MPRIHEEQFIHLPRTNALVVNIPFREKICYFNSRINATGCSAQERTVKVRPMKRILDIALSAPGLLVAFPLILVLGFIIRTESPGPALFKQERVGRGKKSFVCIKLRTMYTGTGHKPTHEIGATSVTPVGSFLRKTRLDELPQLINVLVGDMSLVGPRPCLPSQVELIEARTTENVYTVRPGVTGLAQVRGVDMSNPVKLARLDGEYVRQQTFWGDLKLILETISSVLRNRQSDYTQPGSNPGREP